MIKQIIHALITLAFAAVAVFFLIHLVPGDPAQAMLGEKATPEAIEAIREELGLDRPLLSQLGSFLGRLMQGDLGNSIRSGQPVIVEIKDRLPATIELSVFALLISAILGILLGMAAARKPGGLLDILLGGFAVLGLSIPIFFLGLLLILVFGMWLEWFPLSGRLDYSVVYMPITGFIFLDAILTGDLNLFLTGLKHLTLPAVALATVPMSLIARLMRSSQMEAIRADFIRTARAKGQKEVLIFFKHAFRNALLPVITMIGFQFSLLLGGVRY